MRLALHFPNFTMPGAPERLATTLADTARAADQGGFATMTVMDHWFQMIPMGGSAEPMLEAYTTLGYLAGVTERIELGALVTGITYRYPALLAKIVTTLDVLSQGRAMLGVGAAWYQEEHEAYGVPFPPLKERFERLRETLEICEQMWGDDDGPYEGAHYRVGATICNPKPLHRPRVLIGGGGERKTLRLVAEHGDACNLFDLGPEEVGRKLEVLRRHCDEVGRDYGAIQKTLTTSGEDAETDADAFLHRMEGYAAIGIEQVWVRAAAPDPAGTTARLGETLVPRLAELGA
jgi:F420-dependent oxidoreductase-like protein